jgi:hypothetical protein
MEGSNSGRVIPAIIVKKGSHLMKQHIAFISADASEIRKPICQAPLAWDKYTDAYQVVGTTGCHSVTCANCLAMARKGILDMALDGASTINLDKARQIWESTRPDAGQAQEDEALGHQVQPQGQFVGGPLGQVQKILEAIRDSARKDYLDDDYDLLMGYAQMCDDALAHLASLKGVQ